MLFALKLNAKCQDRNATAMENSILVFPGYYLANHIELYNVAKGKEKYREFRRKAWLYWYFVSLAKPVESPITYGP